MNLYLTESAYRAFQSLIRSLGYSVSEFVDQVIISSVANSSQLQPRPQINLSIAIAKAEAKPVINVGDYVAQKQLDTIISKVKGLKDKADRERRESDTPISYTVSRSKELEEDILRVLRGVKKISPAKLEEVNAALTILRSIRGGA